MHFPACPWQRGGLRSLPPRRHPIWELWTLTLHNSGVRRTSSNHHPMPTGAPGRRTLLAGPSLHDRQFRKEVFARGHIYIYLYIYILYLYIYIYNTAHCLSYIQYNGVLHIDQWSHRCRSKGLERKPISVFCPSCLLPFLLACLLHSPRSLSDCCPIFGVVWRVCTCNGLAVWDEFQK
jgi:hypothetical protein